MNLFIDEILKKEEFNKDEIVYMLNTKGIEQKKLFTKASSVKDSLLGNIVYLRGIIEFSNICSKNCYYCGIRKDNENVIRYNLTDDEILKASKFAYENNYGSIVLQSGEINSKTFIKRIENLIRNIKDISNGKLGITLSLGEQDEETYFRWFEAGAHRYLLRIETSNETLYSKLHPDDNKHSYQYRLHCIKTLQKIGYQTGTGVMIGLPFQNIEDLADDLIFMKNIDIDMVGMGPYIEHNNTPLINYKSALLPLTERFELTLKMIAVLRIMMQDINIAATTALQSIDKNGREKAILIGANVFMPNITPGKYRDYYKLYENKPCTDEDAEDCKNCIDLRLSLINNKIGYNEWGDSKHFALKQKNILANNK